MKKAKTHIIAPYLANPNHIITIALIGTGGTGSHMLSNLAMINQALIHTGRVSFHVTAYDPDIVSESNIGRQLFSPADIHRNKAIVLVERINRFYGFAWDAMPEKYNGEEQSSNIIISCVDTLKAREDVFKKIKKRSFHGDNYSDHKNTWYWMDIGNERNHGQVILGTVFKGRIGRKTFSLPHFFDEFQDVQEENIGDACSAHAMYNKQNLFINKFMATLASNMIWTLFKDYQISYRGIYFNLDRFSMTQISI